MDRLAMAQGEVVGEKQLIRERIERRAQVNVAVAVMSLITLVAVMLTIFLLREPGPPGPPGPIPISAQFIRDDAGCLYRVIYKTHNGTAFAIDARAQPENCNG